MRECRFEYDIEHERRKSEGREKGVRGGGRRESEGEREGSQRGREKGDMVREKWGRLREEREKEDRGRE